MSNGCFSTDVGFPVDDNFLDGDDFLAEDDFITGVVGNDSCLAEIGFTSDDGCLTEAGFLAAVSAFMSASTSTGKKYGSSEDAKMFPIVG